MMLRLSPIFFPYNRVDLSNYEDEEGYDLNRKYHESQISKFSSDIIVGNEVIAYLLKMQSQYRVTGHAPFLFSLSLSLSLSRPINIVPSQKMSNRSYRLMTMERQQKIKRDSE